MKVKILKSVDGARYVVYTSGEKKLTEAHLPLCEKFLE